MDRETKNELVSVIVPVYNVGKYLDECIESICRQTYYNIEIIIVDDGSTDNSGKKCDEWERKDNRINVIHKTNGGLSDARNCGLDFAKGDWILFVDSDDYIDCCLIEKCLKIVNEFSDSDIDILFFGYKEFLEDDNVTVDGNILTQPYILESKDAIRDIVYGTLPVMVCTKLYKAKIWNNLRFPIGRIHEDDYVIMPTLNLAKNVCITKEQFYFYRRRKASLSNTVNIKEIRDRLDVYKNRLGYFKSDTELLPVATYHYLCTFIIVYFECDPKNRKSYWKEYRKEYKKIGGNLPKDKLILLRLFYLYPALYKMIVTTMKSIRLKKFRKDIVYIKIKIL